MPPTVIIADRRDGGETLAAVLKSRLSLSWSQAKRVIDRRHVRVGGQIVADPAFRVKPGKRITVAAGAVEAQGPGARGQGQEKTAPPSKAAARPKPAAKSPPAAPAPLPPRPLPLAPTILYADDDVVVVDKPAGLTTSRNAAERAEFGKGKGRFLPPTLAELLPGLLGTPDRPVIPVHRLDRDTSGVVAFARTRAAADHLSQQFRKHTADRQYLALVRGEPVAGRIESVLVPDRGDGRRGSARPGREVGGKKAVTRVAVLERFDRFALVECRLETGRTHQVRIHLGEAGTPLCGEAVYDRPVNGKRLPDGSGAERPMLHAAKLGFAHPTTGERRTWETPPPKDFVELLEKLRTGERGA
jgi:23S rRNA pseudouridine1911/1915/1917 synthase